MSNCPTLDAIKSLDGKNFAMLSAEELSVLDFYRDHGRKFGVSVALLSDADPKALAQAGRQHADEIMRRANSHVKITIGEGAQEAWIARSRFDETEKLVTSELRGFLAGGMSVGRKTHCRDE